MKLALPQLEKVRWRPQGERNEGTKTRDLPIDPPAPQADRAARRGTPAVPSVPRPRNNALLAVAAALALIAGGLAWSVAQGLEATEQVLVAASSLTEGQPLAANDLRTIEIAVDEGDLQALAPSQADRLVGLIAAGPIAEGTLLHPRQFVQPTDIDSVVVGAALGPNHYPTKTLIRGDIVRLIEVSESTRSTRSSDAFESGVELAVGEVVEVVELGSNDSIHVSIRISESVASVVTNRIAQGRLALALIDQDVDLTEVVPLEPAQPVDPADVLEPGADR